MLLIWHNNSNLAQLLFGRVLIDYGNSILIHKYIIPSIYKLLCIDLHKNKGFKGYMSNIIKERLKNGSIH